MIDTVKLRSPYLSTEVAALVEQHMTRRMAVEIDSGEVLYEITTEELDGSFDNRIMLRLMREEMGFLEQSAGGRPVFVPKQCPPYLLIEGSVHKALIGHNITSGPASFQAAALWFVNLVGNLLWVSLPHGSEWSVERVDVTECYRLPYEAVEEFIASLNSAQYPRRKPHRYGSEAIFFPGTTTAAKVYHKGPEFAKHDHKRLLSIGMSKEEVKALQHLANGIMRVEISIKAKKLKADFGGKPLVVQVTDTYLEGVHDREVARFLREGQRDMETVRTAVEVSRRLAGTYETQLANTLYGFWSRMATVGELEVRKNFAPSTFRKYRKCLVSAGCSWAGTDIIIRETTIPVGFSLSRSSPFRDRAEDLRITEQLATWRAAA